MLEHEQGDPHAGAAEVGDRQVRVHRAAHVRVAFRHQDRRRREQRHQLPEGQERGHIAGGEHADEREQKPGGECADPPRTRAPG